MTQGVVAQYVARGMFLLFLGISSYMPAVASAFCIWTRSHDQGSRPILGMLLLASMGIFLNDTTRTLVGVKPLHQEAPKVHANVLLTL